MPDFWFDSGFDLAGRDADGELVVSDALLRAWWLHPE
jgi:hypothetical protein